jgi:hypothetical protein
MKTKKITYRQLQDVLLRLGYAPAESASAGVFRHPKTHLPVILPKMPSRAHLKPIDLLSVQNTLANSGIVAKEDFDSLFFLKRGDRLIWTEPSTGAEIEVTAASDESDGWVIINQKGAYSPCPIEQLKKVE